MTQARMRALPVWSFAEPGRVVLFSPHPDDETLGAGGTLNLLQRAGCEIQVVALSDGEAAYPEAGPRERAVLAELRAAEQARALAELGIPEGALSRWRLPDGGLSEVPALTARMVAALSGARYCFAPFRQDGHPDHDAVGRAAAVACEQTGTRLCEYPIWAWHWRRPDGFESLWTRGRRIALDDEAQRRKAQALQHYLTQLHGFHGWGVEHPVLPAAVLAHFSRSFETVLL